AQMYHVTTDNAFPYRVYGGQQESGSVGIASRGNDGAITLRDWHPVGTEEYGYSAPDPLDPNIVYGGKGSRYDWRTGQTQDVGPEPVRTGKYRWVRTAPMIFAHADPHTLYLASNVLFRTTNGGNSWETISPDLTRDVAPAPPTLGSFVDDDPAHGVHRGVIYSVAPSYHDANVIWAGTDDGLIHVTRDGGQTWTNVTPSTLGAWSKIAQLDASHFDEQTVYAAVNRFRLDDLRPHILRTHDGGRTWTEIVNGLPSDAPANVVREDPVRKGLLYAGTETSVYVSFDDGDHWQPLQLNLPHTSVRDLVVKDSDLVVGTHGRSIWILDDVTPLRQLSPGVTRAPAHLFRPAGAFRVMRNTNPDTPMPPEESAGQNPPDGAIIDYYIGASPRTPVTLEILDASGNLVRRFASDDVPDVTQKQIDALNVPAYWVRPPRTLPATAGMHRWIWNLHYPDPSVLVHEYPISAIYHDTPQSPLGAAVLPGTYTVRLTVDGKQYTQPLVVKMDPRVPATSPDLAQQFTLSRDVAAMIERDFTAIAEMRALRVALAQAKGRAKNAAISDAIESLDARVVSAQGQGPSAPRTNVTRTNVTRLNGSLSQTFQSLQSADARPTTQATAFVPVLRAQLDTALAQWDLIKGAELVSLNARLKSAGMPAIVIPSDLSSYRRALQQGESADRDANEP
ncbi:MAG TPA: hypothetical protein VGT98_03655, partial [Candidatus Elarobacter sp.]|nr:hypothetical protein [Candidatus Elarobacter sp.]